MLGLMGACCKCCDTSAYSGLIGSVFIASSARVNDLGGQSFDHIFNFSRVGYKEPFPFNLVYDIHFNAEPYYKIGVKYCTRYNFDSSGNYIDEDYIEAVSLTSGGSISYPSDSPSDISSYLSSFISSVVSYASSSGRYVLSVDNSFFGSNLVSLSPYIQSDNRTIIVPDVNLLLSLQEALDYFYIKTSEIYSIFRSSDSSVLSRNISVFQIFTS